MEKARLFQGPFLLPQKRERKRIMSVQLSYKEGVLTALLSGEIDNHNARQLRTEIDEAAVRVLPAVLRLDFSGVEFMDSSGIGLVLGRVRLLQFWKGRVVLCGLSPSLGRMVELSGIGTLASIERRAG